MSRLSLADAQSAKNTEIETAFAFSALFFAAFVMLSILGVLSAFALGLTNPLLVGLGINMGGVALILFVLLRGMTRARRHISNVVAFVIEQSRRELLVWERKTLTPAPPPPPLTEGSPPAVDALPDLRTATTNQANEDFKLALAILEAALQELSKVSDGEKLLGKPFAYDRCQAAGTVSRWEDWSRIMDLWEAAEIAKHPRRGSGWEVLVQSVREGERRLANLYAQGGFVKLNGAWLKK